MDAIKQAIKLPLSESLLACDIMQANCRGVTLEDDVSQAIENIIYNQAEIIAVIDKKSIIDVITQTAIMKLYLDTIRKNKKSFQSNKSNV